MSKPPVLRSREVVSALCRAGFVVHHQTGSHARLRHPDGRSVTVAVHARDVPLGTLRRVIQQAGLTAEQFAKLL